MKTSLFIALFLSFSAISYAQVGIGTANPSNSAMLEVSATDKGFLLPRMTSVQRTAITAPVSGLQVYDNDTQSIWYYNGSFWVNTQAMGVVGDVKSGMQTADHSGWIRLNGRAISTLSVSQRAAALALFGASATNIPDASNRYLAQNGATPGAVSGSNTTTLSQNNLPNVNFPVTIQNNGDHNHYINSSTANTSSGGNHNHTFSPTFSSTTAGWGIGGGGAGLTIAGTTNTSFNGAHLHSVTIPAAYSASNGTHSHSATVSSGGSGTPINVAPATLSVNMFIYLGL